MSDNKNTFEEAIDFGRIFRLVLMQSKLIIIITILSAALSFLNYSLSEKMYKISSMIQVYSSSPGIGSNSSLDFMLGGSSSLDIHSLTALYESRNNIIKVINDLNLNVTFNDLADNEFIDIDNLSFADQSGSESYKLFFEFNTLDINVLSENNNLLKTINYGEMFHGNDLSFSVEGSNLEPGQVVEVLITTPAKKYKNLVRDLNISTSVSKNSFYRSDGLINISYTSNDPEAAIKFIDYANEVFINGNIEDETEKARKAIEFLEQRLNSIEITLDRSKQKLKIFQETNKSINVDLEIQSIIDQIANIEVNISGIEIEIAQAGAIYTDNNPIYANLVKQRDALLSQKSAIESEIKKLPFAQQEFIALSREVELSQEVYTELANKKLSYSILEASTIGNIKVIDSAYKDIQVSPTFAYVILFTLFGFFVSVLISIIRGLYFIPISNPAELQDHSINTSIIGVIPCISEEIDNMTFYKGDERFSQSIENTVFNIRNIGKEIVGGKTVLITSPTPFNGKSFLSRNIAYKLADIGRRVLLIDSDLKRGVQHKFFKGVKRITVQDFYNLSSSNLDKIKVDKNIYVLPKFKGLSNSFKLIFSPEYHEKIEELKAEFDYIIFDTAPILSVSDTSVLMSISDVNIAVIRHGLSKINEIKQLVNLSSQTGKEFSGMIYNAYERPNSYYGYYGLYGNYAYQYYAQKYLYENAYDYSTNETND